MLQTGITNLLAQKSSDFTINLNGNMLGKDAESKPQNLTFDVVVQGDSSKVDEFAANFNTKLTANVKVNQDAYVADAELRGDQKNLFAVLIKLTGPEKDIPKDQIAAFVNKWWKIPLPENFYQDLVKNADSSASLLKIQQIYQASIDYLKDISYEGVDTVGGLKSYHYTAEVDAGKLKAFLQGYFKSNGGELTDENLKDFNDFFDNAKTNAEFWVSMDGQILNRIKFDVKMNKILGSDGKSAGKGELHFDMAGSNYGKTVTVQEPVGAQEFDLFGMLEGLGIDPTGGATVTPEPTPAPAPATKVPAKK